jgi:superfamily I DNA/RNA helicase
VIGSEAFGISAFTFHAFCARLHSTFPAEFATTRESIPIDALRQIQVFREILASGKFELLAPLRAPDLYLRDLSSALSSLKREGIAPERFRAILVLEKEKLGEQERINPKTKKPFGKILTAEKRLAKNFELADFYQKYQIALDEKGFTDFDDLILSVVEKLNSKEDLRSEAGAGFLLAYLQENFLYAMVDEFQDTNKLQWNNLFLMIEEALSTGGSLFYVGDKKQAIYRFRGGNVKLFDDIKTDFAQFNINDKTSCI